jgi:hypothetical protein
MKLIKIISGGQTGADMGGLEAARILDIETGGTAPPYFMTEKGPNFELRDEYNLKEGESDKKIYVKRTIANIKNSDGTAIFGNMKSSGSKLTLKECKYQDKPIIINPTAMLLYKFIMENDIKILNVAGNRESKDPYIKNKVIGVIIGVINIEKSLNN